MEGLKKLWPAQWPLTMLATGLLIFIGKTKDTRPRLMIPALACGVLAVLIWWSRRLQEGALYKDGMKLAESGRHAEALGLLIRAEVAWGLNSAHDTPKTIAKDFLRLTAIVTAIQEQADRLRLGLDTKDYLAAIATYVKVYSDKKSLIFGTHILKAGPKKEIQQVKGVFPTLRGRFQATCRELYRVSGGPPISGLETFSGP